MASEPDIGQADFFQVCREALGLTVTELQTFLCVKDRMLVFRMEIGEVPISGTIWALVMSRLLDEGHEDLAARVEGIVRTRREEVLQRNQKVRREQRLRGLQ